MFRVSWTGVYWNIFCKISFILTPSVKEFLREEFQQFQHKGLHLARKRKENSENSLLLLFSFCWFFVLADNDYFLLLLLLMFDVDRQRCIVLLLINSSTLFLCWLLINRVALFWCCAGETRRRMLLDDVGSLRPLLLWNSRHLTSASEPHTQCTVKAQKNYPVHPGQKRAKVLWGCSSETVD